MDQDVIEVQSTPNPNAKKFVLNRPVFETSYSFFSAEAASGHPLAKRLFAIDGVTSILLLDNFVTINKSFEARWADISKAVRNVIVAAE